MASQKLKFFDWGEEYSTLQTDKTFEKVKWKHQFLEGWNPGRDVPWDRRWTEYLAWDRFQLKGTGYLGSRWKGLGRGGGNV